MAMMIRLIDSEIKKKSLFWVLAFACLLSALTLLLYHDASSPRLQSFAQADSLIHLEMALFNIPDNKIRKTRFTVTENFTRKHLFVQMPIGISKTHLHAELVKALHPFEIETIGRANVPGQELSLFFYYRERLIRSMTLRNDPDYFRIPHPAYLYFYFEQQPTPEILDRITDLNIPSLLMLRSDSHRRLSRWFEQVEESDMSVGLWFDDSVAFDNWDTNPSIVRSLETAAGSVSPFFLLINDQNHHSITAQELKKRLSLPDTELHLMDHSSMLFIHSEDRFAFDQKMLRYSRLAREAGNPHIMVPATEPVLDWLDEWIPRIKRGGIIFKGPQTH